MRTKYKYLNRLTGEEQSKLKQVISKGKSSARPIRQAQILLLADKGKTDKEISGALPVSQSTDFRTRRRYAQVGLEATITEKPLPGQRKKLNEKTELFLVNLVRY